MLPPLEGFSSSKICFTVNFWYKYKNFFNFCQGVGGGFGIFSMGLFSPLGFEEKE